MEFNPKKFQERESDVMSNPERAPQRKNSGFPLNLTFSDLIVLQNVI